MALDGTRPPGQLHPSFERRIVVAEPIGKALQGLQRTGGGAPQQGIEVLGLPLAGQRGKILRKVNRLVHCGMLGAQLGKLLRLVFRALGLASEDQRGRAARREGLARGLRHDGQRLAPARASVRQALRLAEAARVGGHAVRQPTFQRSSRD
jgi:hypothetical protein